MNEYIKKEELLTILNALPISEFNGIEMYPKNQVLEAVTSLSASKITTKMRRNYCSQVYCQHCNQVVALPCWEVEHLGHCPHCGLEIDECVF